MAVDTLVGHARRVVQQVERAIGAARHGWRSLEQLEVSDYLVAVLPLRNFDVFDAFWLVLSNHSAPTAEMLLRPLFEGTVVLEWCAADFQRRSLRFRLTTFESTLELIDSGFLRRDDAYVQNLRESVAWIRQQGHKGLPDMRALVDDVELFNVAAGYPTYKLLSKNLHGRLENWRDFADTDGTASVSDFDWSTTPRFLHCSAIATYLALRNLELLSTLLPELDSQEVRVLGREWLRLFNRIQAEEALVAGA